MYDHARLLASSAGCASTWIHPHAPVHDDGMPRAPFGADSAFRAHHGPDQCLDGPFEHALRIGRIGRIDRDLPPSEQPGPPYGKPEKRDLVVVGVSGIAYRTKSIGRVGEVPLTRNGDDRFYGESSCRARGRTLGEPERRSLLGLGPQSQIQIVGYRDHLRRQRLPSPESHLRIFWRQSPGFGIAFQIRVPLRGELRMDPLGVPPFALQTGRAQIASDPLEIAIIEGIVFEIVEEYVRPHLRSAPGAYRIEIYLIRNEGVACDEPDLRPREGFQSAIAFDGDRPAREIAFDDIGDRTQLAYLAAPSKILGRRTEGIHVVLESVLSARLMDLQTMNPSEALHVFDSLRELQTRVYVYQLQLRRGLPSQCECREGILASRKRNGDRKPVRIALLQEPSDLPDGRSLYALDMPAVATDKHVQARGPHPLQTGRSVQIADLDGAFGVLHERSVDKSHARTDLGTLAKDERIPFADALRRCRHIGSRHALAFEMAGHPREPHCSLGGYRLEELRAGLPEVQDRTPPAEVVAQDSDDRAAGNDLVRPVLPRDLVEKERTVLQRSIRSERVMEKRQDHIHGLSHARTDVPGTVYPELPARRSAFGT